MTWILKLKLLLIMSLKLEYFNWLVLKNHTNLNLLDYFPRYQLMKSNYILYFIPSLIILL